MPLSEPLLDIQVYDAINEETELPNITYPDSDEAKSIIEFHACEFYACVYIFNLPLSMGQYYGIVLFRKENGNDASFFLQLCIFLGKIYK